MFGWFKHRWADLTTNVVAGLILMAIVAAFSSGGLVIWSLFISAPAPFVVGAGLFAVGGSVALVNQGLAVARRLQERYSPWATALQLTQPYLAGLSIRLTDLVYEQEIRGRTFEACDLYGPIVIFANGPGMINDCDFVAPQEATFIEVSPDQKVLTGVVLAPDCVFRRCRFTRVGIMGSKLAIERWKSQSIPDKGES